MIRTTEILHLESLDLNFLYKMLIICIYSIKCVYKIMMLCMCCRVIQCKQWVKIFKCFLCRISTHLLRLIQYNNRIIRFYNIYRTSASKLISLIINNTGFLASSTLFHGCIKCLHIDNHDIYSGIT